MVLIRTGSGVTDIRGSIAGNVFTRDKSGLHCNPHGRTIKKRSNLQDKRRRAYRQCVNSWNNSITTHDRRLWLNFSQHHPKKNKIGDRITLTPFAAFLSINIYRAYNDVSLLSTPPPD